MKHKAKRWKGWAVIATDGGLEWVMPDNGCKHYIITDRRELGSVRVTITPSREKGRKRGS